MYFVSGKNGLFITPAKNIVHVSVICFFMANSAHAQENAQSSINLGEGDLYPSVSVNYDSIDNIYRVDQEDALEATGIRIEPEAIFIANKRGVEVKFGYEGSYASYSEDELNYDDHHLFGSADLRLGTKKRLLGDIYVEGSHQDFGTGLSRNASNIGMEQIELLEMGFNTQFTYGAPTARFNLGGGLSAKNIGYQNREALTNGRDYLEISPFGRLSYRVSVDTRVLVELRVSNLNFDNDLLDRNVFSLVTGLTFSGTGKAGGEAKIGAASSRYSEVGNTDSTIFVADVGFYFTPSSVSRIDFGLSRQFNDAEANDAAFGSAQSVDDLVSLSWRTRWSGFISSTAFLKYQNKNRDCPDVGASIFEGGLQVSVKPRRWLELGASASNSDQRAGLCAGVETVTEDYEVQKATMFFKVSL